MNYLMGIIICFIFLNIGNIDGQENDTQKIIIGVDANVLLRKLFDTEIRFNNVSNVGNEYAVINNDKDLCTISIGVFSDNASVQKRYAQMRNTIPVGFTQCADIPNALQFVYPHNDPRTYHLIFENVLIVLQINRDLPKKNEFLFKITDTVGAIIDALKNGTNGVIYGDKILISKIKKYHIVKQNLIDKYVVEPKIAGEIQIEDVGNKKYEIIYVSEQCVISEPIFVGADEVFAEARLQVAQIENEKKAIAKLQEKENADTLKNMKSIISMIKDEYLDVDQRITAVRAVGKAKVVSAIPTLTMMINKISNEKNTIISSKSNNYALATAIINALFDINDKKSIAALMAIVKKSNLGEVDTDSNIEVRIKRIALQRLSRSNDRALSPFFLTVANNPDEYPTIRQIALEISQRKGITH